MRSINYFKIRILIFSGGLILMGAIGLALLGGGPTAGRRFFGLVLAAVCLPAGAALYRLRNK